MDSELDPRFDPVFQRGHEDDPVAPPSPVIERSRDPLERVEPVETSRRKNPWLPILWILSITLLAFGLWAQWHGTQLTMRPNLDNVTEYYILPTVLLAIAPWFGAVGLASLVGVVFLHAVKWHER